MSTGHHSKDYITKYKTNTFNYLDFNRITYTDAFFSKDSFENFGQKFIFPSYSENEFPRLLDFRSFSRSMFTRKQTRNVKLIRTYFRSADVVHKITRRYTTFSDFLGNLIGISTYSLFVTLLLANSFNQFKSKEELVNGVLKSKESYNLDKDEEDKINQLNKDFSLIFKKNEEINGSKRDLYHFEPEGSKDDPKNENAKEGNKIEVKINKKTDDEIHAFDKIDDFSNNRNENDSEKGEILELKENRINENEENNGKDVINVKENEENKEKLNQEKKAKFENDSKFKFRPLEFFCSCFFSSKTKKQLELYEESYKKIDRHMNIFHYLTLNQEFDILKSLLFNENQIRLIDFVSKQTVEIETEYEIIENKLAKDKDIEPVLESYENILREKDLNQFDVKLIKMTNCEFKDLME